MTLIVAAALSVDGAGAALERVLDRHVKNGVVDYGALARDRGDLDSYVASLATAPVDGFSAAQAKAFWINAYNALTLRLIRDEKPKKSIRDLDQPWKKFRFKVAGSERTLDEIEHEILRKKYPDGRLHCVLVCAAKSCPILESRAFEARDLDRRLDDAARRFVRDRTKNRYDPQTNTLHASRIFEWFAADFSDTGVVGFFNRYLERPIPADAKVQYVEYDWQLNGTW